MNWRRSLRTYLQPRRHTALLIAIIVAFAIRPLIGNEAAGLLLFSMALVVLLLVALYTVSVDDLTGDRATLLAQRRRQSRIAFVLGAVATCERLAILFVHNLTVYRLGSIGWLAFFGYITIIEFRALLRHKAVSSETISMAVSVYLLLGLTWGVFYIVLYSYQPDAFHFETPLGDATQNFPIFVYFSLTTLSTIGFGDITPVSLQARYAAVAEGIAGQLYLAILVARLVATQMSTAERGARND